MKLLIQQLIAFSKDCFIALQASNAILIENITFQNFYFILSYPLPSFLARLIKAEFKAKNSVI